jgi:hypothetical protein
MEGSRDLSASDANSDPDHTEREQAAARDRGQNNDASVMENGQAVDLSLGWACSRCTFRNAPNHLACGQCRSARDASNALEWECSMCTFRNAPDHLACGQCRSARDANNALEWECSMCTFRNAPDHLACGQCRSARDASSVSAARGEADVSENQQGGSTSDPLLLDSDTDSNDGDASRDTPGVAGLDPNLYDDDFDLNDYNRALDRFGDGNENKQLGASQDIVDSQPVLSFNGKIPAFLFNDKECKEFLNNIQNEVCLLCLLRLGWSQSKYYPVNIIFVRDVSTNG